MTGSRTQPGTHVAEHAPCWGELDFAVADDRWKTEKDLVAICAPNLYVCGGCPYRAECIQQVLPAKSNFDGICGGRIWLNGTIIHALPEAQSSELLAPVIRKSCGTAAGSRAHRRAVEQQCPRCELFARFMPDPADEAEQLELPDIS
ncbi:hypothetical protein SRB5_15990 [Streptomyces sp. RB5]|uniref:4Fe-4S Wbl-type domain-containing protein n=1 Tax=Streptomyces smaragdinus TaxID=2585196 RepID=A0A7K0CDE6_9ACTN|nr:hypothetical protein [Streptomyces smaragdinus]MQY11480.1 hypothetical protein [Streptomyces smaragdinus]